MEFVIALVFLLFFTSTAYDPLDPTGNITIRWDVQGWTEDGYTAMVTMYNYQQYRHIEEPGWSLGWTWAKNEIIWNMIGSQATEQGDCSKFKKYNPLPHSCKKEPTIVDLLSGARYNDQIEHCCRGGVLSSLAQDPTTAVSKFELTVGSSGASRKTVRLPRNFTLKTPGPGYTCGPAKIVRPTRYLSSDKRRTTQALMTWDITCTYSQFLAQRTPTCCVSLSSFYNDTVVSCPACTCGCQDKTQPESCVNPESPPSSSIVSSSGNNTALVRCTSHMCPIRVHWHVKLNYKDYWRIKITISNFNYRMNYSHWNLVVQHPNLEDISRLYSFMYKPLDPYEGLNDTGVLWGIKYFNDILSSAGPHGHVQSEVLLRKNKTTFTLDQGWGFPRRIYFNGDYCVMPPPDVYPWLPSASSKLSFFEAMYAIFIVIVIVIVIV